MSGLAGVLRREFTLNRKVTLSHLPLLLIFVVVGVFAGRAAGRSGTVLVMAISLSVFFSMLHFVNVYLQQSKDKDLQFLAALPLRKSDIVAGKFAYLAIVVLFFNGLTHAAMISLIGDWEICLNSFLLSSFLGVLIGMVVLGLFLFVNFENLMGYSQVLRAAIIAAFILAVYLMKADLTSLRESMHFNPVLPFALYIGCTGLLYTLMRSRFLKKRSYL